MSAEPQERGALRVGLAEAERIVRNAAGYWFGGELVPFADAFKERALEALAALRDAAPSGPERIVTHPGVVVSAQTAPPLTIYPSEPQPKERHSDNCSDPYCPICFG